jgi:1,4-dihydroxy-6-naphthoate synthase
MAGRPALDTGRYRFETIAEDIEVLNERAERGLYDITALSCAHWARVAASYVLTACGASVGDGYGPKLVARGPVSASTLDTLRRPDAIVAVPGVRTTAFMVTSLLLGPGSFRATRWRRSTRSSTGWSPGASPREW